MSGPAVEKIANAVLYEGYVLYPYRSSAVKNRERWNFGVVYPQAYSEAQGGFDACRMETQCLALGGPRTALSVKVRCLRLVDRVAGLLAEPVAQLPPNGELVFLPAASIEVAGRTYESWQEAAECEMRLPDLHFGELAARQSRQRFAHPATKTVELLRDDAGLVAGLIERTQEPLDCWIETSLDQPQDGLFRLSVRIFNDSPLTAAPASREAALARSLLSAHTILRLHDGEFVSLLEPPPQFQEAATACQNVGTWPVLAGEEGARDTILSSPIILYDYPQIAPESPGDLFDGGEIDEILSLRILTLTDDEKDAMRRSDERTRRILERTESLPSEHFMKLHGVLRNPDSAGKERHDRPRGADSWTAPSGLVPTHFRQAKARKTQNSSCAWRHGSGIRSGIYPSGWKALAHHQQGAFMNEWEWQLLEDKTPVDSVVIEGITVRPGDLVRLRPRAGGDVFDLALAGKTATVESIEQDYEGRPHLAVVLDDDPGRDLGMLRQPGHRFFFRPEELDPVAAGGNA